MKSYSEVTIVIISYKSKKKIINFIVNLSKNYRIIIIENSDDKSIKKDIDQLFNNVEIYFAKNIGYGSAANYARTKIKTDYFFLFNPDLEEINSNLIEDFYNYAKKMNNNFSCLGPRFKNISNKTLKQSDIKSEIGFVKSISGAAMFFYTKNFDYIGGFDQNIFLYFEETDYCRRGIKCSLKAFQLNKIKITHNVGTSVEFKDIEEKNNIKKLTIWHFIWSKFYFYKKHYGKFLSALYFIPIILRTYIKILYFDIFKNIRKKEKYKIRLDGLLSSIKGKKSFKRLN